MPKLSSDSRRASRAAYERSDRGQEVRAAARLARHRPNKRKGPKRHLSRVVIPSLVEDWARNLVPLDRPISKAASLPGYDPGIHAVWLTLPFDKGDMVRSEQCLYQGGLPTTVAPRRRGQLDEYELVAMVDGWLYGKELEEESKWRGGLKEAGTNRRKREDILDRARQHIGNLLEMEWAELIQNMPACDYSLSQEVYDRHITFMARRISRLYKLAFE
uniref:Uncharacterized protein n=1 Tax=Mycena chlorophos TaxID=658473 RepID=A0ABQ0KXF6_MYCCL|nr:predicted protein [Mycena chlorophos]